MTNKKIHPLLVVTHIGALLPLFALIWDFTTDSLSINPIQEITLRTGKTALVLLVLTLAVTPINTVFGFRQVIRLRKWLGLYSFFYALTHFLIFIGLDYGFNWTYIREALFEKRFALVGFAAFLLMLPLAITSTKGWQKRLGKRWKTLHRLIYIAGTLVIIHYIWLVKSDYRQPLLFGALVGILLLLRIPAVRKKISSRNSQGVFNRRESIIRYVKSNLSN